MEVVLSNTGVLIQTVEQARRFRSKHVWHANCFKIGLNRTCHSIDEVSRCLVLGDT